MEEKTEDRVELQGSDPSALKERSDDQIEFSRQMEAARFVMEKYKDALQRLADS
jgi:hypothetical protein